MRAQISRLTQRHQPVGTVDEIGRVRRDQRVDRRGAEQAARVDRVRRQQVADQRRQIPLEPRAHRRAEAPLLAVEDVGGKHALQRRLHHVLQPAAADLDVLRNARRELDQLVVEQRHAAFERHRHAHLVGQEQQVVGQLRLRIDGQHPVELVGAAGMRERRRQRLVSVAAPLAQQLGRKVLGEHLDVRTVALFDRQARRGQEALREARGIEQRRVAIARKPLPQRRRRAPQRRGQPVEIGLVVAAEVTPIAAEQLVAADTGENHRHVAMRELRNEIRRDERGVRDRLVHVPQQPGQQRDDVGPDDDLVVVGAEQLRDTARVGQLVVERLRVAAAEADRVGLHRAVAVLRHERDDRARVDAARQERADRHVADHLHARRLLEARAGLRDPVVRGTRRVDGRRNPPVAALLDAAALGHEHRRGRELRDSAEHRLRRRHVAEREIGGQRGRIERGGHAGHRQDRLRFAREQQAPAVVADVQRLHAQPVAADDEAGPPRVPEREREHPVQVLDARVAVGLVQVQDRFAVGRSPERVTLGDQRFAQLAIVVDLAVGDEPQRAVLVRQRLVTAADVDDRQAAHPQRERTVDVDTLVVRAAMDGEPPHRAQAVGRRGRAVELQDAVDAAHGVRRPSTRWQTDCPRMGHRL